MNKLYKTKLMKKLLGLLLLFTGMVYALPPSITNPQNQILFDDYNDNSELFLVYTLAPQILGTLNANNYTIQFAHDPGFQNLIIENMYVYYTNNETVYVKVTENADQNNFATTSFNIILLPTPVIGQAQDIFHMDIPFDYVGEFDLTSQSAAVLNGLTGVDLVYYPSVEDARASTNPITNPTAYTNISNPQYICAKVSYPSTGSFSLSQFKLVVTSVETITIPDNYFKIRVLNAYDYNDDDIIQMSEALSVTSLDFSNADIWNQPVYDVTGIENFTNVKQLFMGRNPLGTVDLTALTNLEYLDMPSTNNTSLNVTGLTHLKSINCDTGQLTSLDVSTCTSLETLICSRNDLTSLNITGLTGITILYCNENELTSLDVSLFPNMSHLCCSDNALTSLDLTGLNQIVSLCYGNQSMAAVDISQLPNLVGLSYAGGLATTLNLDTSPLLQSVWAWNSNLTQLDVSNLPLVNVVRLYNNIDLTYVNLKNGGQFYFNADPINNFSTRFQGNPNLLYVCTNENDLAAINIELNGATADNGAAHTNTYCTFTPGGDYNTITGLIRFDADNNGCDTNDVMHPNMKIGIDDGTLQGETFTAEDGSYNFYTQAGNFIVTPEIENAAWFNFTPTTITIPFADDNNNLTTQNFCVTANGVHNDAEIVLFPSGVARPGFDSPYLLFIKNKGNQPLSGSVNLVFDDARTDFVSALPNADTVAPNSLTWNYTNLLPFETRTIALTLNINSPLETPAVNSNDILPFTATINPIVGDDLPEDNVFNLNQIVVNSFDPNDINCLEGEIVPPSEIGKYLHYVARFENTGNYQAENVVVKIVIDPTKYDVNTLQLLNTSHLADTKITGNIVEFIFRNINLAPAAGDPPVGGHGTIMFKLKSKSTLVSGDEVSNKADIFFDYNAPITTNDARTTFALLSNPGFIKDASVVLHPNPTKGNLKIDTDHTIKSIELYDVQGRILQTSIENTTTAKLDITNKTNGIYFVKITTERGTNIEKVVKE